MLRVWRMIGLKRRPRSHTKDVLLSHTSEAIRYRQGSESLTVPPEEHIVSGAEVVSHQEDASFVMGYENT
jgi:hypothetical protein